MTVYKSKGKRKNRKKKKKNKRLNWYKKIRPKFDQNLTKKKS